MMGAGDEKLDSPVSSTGHARSSLGMTKQVFFGLLSAGRNLFGNPRFAGAAVRYGNAGDGCVAGVSVGAAVAPTNRVP